MVCLPTGFWRLLGIELGDAPFPGILYGSVILGVGLASIAGVRDSTPSAYVLACARPTSMTVVVVNAGLHRIAAQFAQYFTDLSIGAMASPPLALGNAAICALPRYCSVTLSFSMARRVKNFLMSAHFTLEPGAFPRLCLQGAWTLPNYDDLTVAAAPVQVQVSVLDAGSVKETAIRYC